MNETPKPKVLYVQKPKPEPKPKTAFERLMVERVDKLEARLRSVESDTIDLMNHHGW